MNDPTLILRVALWALLGAVVTPVIYLQKGRNPRWGMVTGLVVGAVGSLFLLVPLWVLLSRPRKLCPACENSIPAEAANCPHCDHVFDLPSGGAALHLGYPELVPLILISMVGTVVLLPMIYRGYTLDPGAWLIGGAILGVLIGVFALELLWLVAPRAGRRCPQCSEAVPAASTICPRCGYAFPDVPPDAAQPLRESPLSTLTSRLRFLPVLSSRLTRMRWPWYVAVTVIIGLLLAQVGLAVPLVASERSGSARVLPAVGIPPTPRPNLDIARTTAQAQLSVQGFNFQPYVDESGDAGMLGRNITDETLVYLMGPEESLHTIGITFARPADLSGDLRARQDENLEAVLSLAIHDDDQAAQAREWISAQDDIQQTLRADTQIGLLHLSIWYDGQDNSVGLSITAAE